MVGDFPKGAEIQARGAAAMIEVAAFLKFIIFVGVLIVFCWWFDKRFRN
jgi:hypothetical protein